MGRFLLRRNKAIGTPRAPNNTVQQHTPAENAYAAALGIDPEKGTTSFDERIRKEYRFHTLQYWFVASLANGMLWTQIVIGAALTALGATHSHNAQTATIYLGAATTVISGFLTYFKSRNQPNRSRQFREALRKVRNLIDDNANDLVGMSPEEAREVAKGIVKQYNEALAEASANYPDLWITLGDLKRFMPKNPEEDAQNKVNDKDEERLEPAKLDGVLARSPSMPRSSVSTSLPEKQLEEPVQDAEATMHQLQQDVHSGRNGAETTDQTSDANAPPSSFERPSRMRYSISSRDRSANNT
ncbi:uncharacterized protein AB675_8555 [Cyphellophora attinorum]|uniref:SMODS and SLOG-associating 2TM effector domain-containing protein n=1 Tax=Cyphellophora attinorum TaxID=1664694 RepID=A0A0N0NQY2_9EURO|nr:uncharacterized protein AB675_8555 [Phialophora attinorum]KPI44448.1 hypothetical protein AB675_8555 [Phialophora attinorum]